MIISSCLKKNKRCLNKQENIHGNTYILGIPISYCLHYQRIHKKWWISPAFLVIIRVVSRMSANWMKNLSNRFCAVTMFLIILRQGVDILGCPISSPIQIPIGKHLHSLRKPTGQQRGTTRTAKGELAIRLVHLCNGSKKLYTQCRKMLPNLKGC